MKKDLCETCYVFFSTLSNPTRLAILELLREGPKNVTEISRSLNQEQSMVSHNLKPLLQCHFISVERRWKDRVYYLNRKTISPLLKVVITHKEDFCTQNEECPKKVKES